MQDTIITAIRVLQDGSLVIITSEIWWQKWILEIGLFLTAFGWIATGMKRIWKGGD